MDSLRLTSCMAENADFTCMEMSRYLSDQLKIQVEFVNDIPWNERERLLSLGEIHAGWICGLLYIWKVSQADSPMELLVAPVMENPRYAGQPVYFSDVIVHKSSQCETFSDLKNGSWAYNETQSFSGYYIVLYHLMSLGETSAFFSNSAASGSHQASLNMVIEREADAAAIDSTVLDLEYRDRPGIHATIRTIKTLGPSPIPPWVVSKKLTAKTRDSLRDLLLNMHRTSRGREVLKCGRLSKFVPVNDGYYDPIRQVARQVEAMKAQKESIGQVKFPPVG